ncbi:MAG: hypothetical protein KJ011_05275 [Burkholderiaceae bacterium]|nr:hypothetical protein [Burkholderiaceae bacterium]
MPKESRRRTGRAPDGGQPRGKSRLIAKLPDPSDEDLATAELALSPSTGAAAVSGEYLKSAFGEIGLGALAEVIDEGAKDVWSGDMKRAEAMLYGQAVALQAIFTNMARRVSAQELLRHEETYLRLALKAQSQCRTTLETLALIKQGPAVFARQANIAHGPQQVNNGTMPADARAGNVNSAKTELLEASDGERLDTGATGACGRGDPSLAAVGALDGTAHR